jgi:hypothetical protein
MMHDPFQTYATLGQQFGGQQFGGQHYGMPQIGLPTQIGLPYPQQLQVNPLAALQLAQAAGIPQQLGQSVFGQNPLQSLVNQGLVNPQQQQLQLAALVANNPVLAASLLSNPLVAASLHAQTYGNQFGAQQQYPQQIGQQIGSPFGQIGYPLAPQSWIGQGVPFGVAAQGFGQVNPFQQQINPFQQQVGQRPFQGQGISPWGY